MNFSVISVIFSLLLAKVIGEDIKFRPCQLNGSTKEAVNLKCVQEIYQCLHINDNSKVKVIKYECRDLNGRLQMNFKNLDNFMNLKTIDVSSLQLKDVIVMDTNTSNSISSLNASNNLLKTIPNSVVKITPNVLVVDFSFNQLAKINPSDFDGATKISDINCSNNQINSLVNKPFEKLLDLKVLDLSNNRIAKIGDDEFVNNSNLKVLDLRKNPIKSFNFHVFAKPVQVQLPVESIEVLDVSCRTNCQFVGFDRDAFFPNLRHFNASKSNVNVEKLLEPLDATLKTLDLSYSSIGTLTCIMFQRFVNLQHLNLSHSSIWHIENNALAYQTELLSLDLSHNGLHEVNGSIFSRFKPTLQSLNLDHNNLAKIDGITPAKFPDLTKFVISNNQFTCNKLQIILNEWENGTQFQFTNSQSSRTNIKGVDCNCEATVIYVKENSTMLPYIVTIAVLIAIPLSVVVATVIGFIRRRHGEDEVNGGLIKTNAEAQSGDPNDSGINTGSMYEEIDLQNVTFQNELPDIQSRPLPTPSDDDRSYGRVRRIEPSPNYMYARVCKRDFS